MDVWVFRAAALQGLHSSCTCLKTEQPLAWLAVELMALLLTNLITKFYLLYSDLHTEAADVSW